MTKAISLLSGGLDSILATKLILNQGIEVEAVNFLTVFSSCADSGKIAADKLGIKVKNFDISKEFLEIVKKPKYGYGSNINPCLDCRIFIFKKAGEYMKTAGASFLITGEVLGERPMSQRKDALRIVDRDSRLEGLILRPLSAKLLEPTIPEKEGLVDREKLLAIEGRSRKPQIKLARDLGIEDYPSPAGGCLLTDPAFADRMRDLTKEGLDFTVSDVELLKVGRHFRLAPDVKLIVGRNQKENEKLLNLAKEIDLCLYPTKTKGPIGIIRGGFNKDILATASSIMARYCDKDESRQIEIAYKKFPNGMVSSVSALPAEEEKLGRLRI